MPVHLLLVFKWLVEMLIQLYQFDAAMWEMNHYHLNHTITMNESLSVWHAWLFETELFW